MYKYIMLHLVVFFSLLVTHRSNSCVRSFSVDALPPTRVPPSTLRYIYIYIYLCIYAYMHIDKFTFGLTLNPIDKFTFFPPPPVCWSLIVPTLASAPSPLTRCRRRACRPARCGRTCGG